MPNPPGICPLPLKFPPPYLEGVAAIVDTDSMGIEAETVDNAQVNTMLMPIQHEYACHSSLGRCLSSSPSRVDMLCNLSHHVLLTYKNYNKGWLGYLQHFTRIDSPHRNAL